MEDDSLIRFSASDATREHEVHALRETHSYTKHLNACKTRLRRFIKEHPEQTFLVYAVPMIVVGSALRDAKSIINHIIHRLRKDGFDSHYLGSNLIFIQWNASERHDGPHDYVTASKKRRSVATSNLVTTPLTSDALAARRGPGPPIIVSDQERTKARLEYEMQRRLSSYEHDTQHPNAQRRKHFENYTSHQDALRAAVAPNRTTL